MKKYILGTALAATVAIGAGAKTADQLRVYLNPGHGSWTANDRPLPVMGHESAHSRYNTDTLSFFESNTNLRKMFAILERLRQYGLKYDPSLNQTGERWQIGAARDMSNNIVMSHVKCGPYGADNPTPGQITPEINQLEAITNRTPEQEARLQECKKLLADGVLYNRNLSEICAEVNANHFDVFVSVHSNAATEGTTTNFPIFLYRGYDDCHEDAGVTAYHQTESRKMAELAWPYIMENPFPVWTAYSKTQTNCRGDLNFYGSGSTNSAGYKGYLGVLKHGTIGYLAEGYFHTYQPARHRAMNWDVDYLEGDAYAHGLADYLGLTKEKTGALYGLLRDKYEKFTSKVYSPNPKSHDAFLSINGGKVVLKQGDKVVAEYTTDNFYNGAFVFRGLEPGKYTLWASHPDYKDADPVEVEVTAANTAYAPIISLVNKNWVAPEVIYENYPDPAAEMTSVKPADEYNFAASFTDEAIPGLEGKIIRRAIARDGKIYVLAHDKAFTYKAVLPADEKPAATLLVYDVAKKAVVANVSTNGMHGSVLDASDLQVTSDGVLLASNCTKTQYADAQIEAGDEGRGTFTIYRWDNDENGLPTGDPKPWLNTQNTGRWYRAYPGRFSYSGTSKDGFAFIGMPTISAPEHKMRSSMIGVANGAQSGVADYLAPNDGPTGGYGIGTLGADYAFITSPLSPDNLYVFGSNGKAFEYKYNWTDKVDAEHKANDVLAALKAPGQVSAFRYAGASYLAVPEFAEGKATGVKLVDISKNIDNAAVVATANTALAELAAPNAAAMGEVAVNRNDENKVTAAWINLYVLRDGKLTKLTTQGVEQPKIKAEYAYGLDMTAGETDYTLTYKLTGKAIAATVVATPVDGGDAISFPGTVNVGDNQVVVKKSDLAEGKSYTWAVNVEGRTVSQAGLVAEDPSGLTVRGSVVPVTDPEQPSFGYVVVGHGKAQGFDVYDPAGQKVATRIFKGHNVLGGSANTNQSDPIRGDQRDGKVVFGGWGDKSEGIFYFDPLNTDNDLKTLFAGTKQSNGNHIYNGANLGGGTSGICFTGNGDATKLYSFSEDHENKNGGGATENTICRYDIGSAWQITEAPVSLGFKGLLQNTNVDLVTYGNGFFASQVRGAGNNLAGTPCFAYYSETVGDMTCNSATYTMLNASNSALAITRDGKTLAVAEGSRILVFDVKWDAQGTTPSLSFKYDFPTKAIDWATMRFDYAGNLHAFERATGGYKVYSLLAEKPVVTTPAKALFLLTAGQSGVADIAVDTEAPATYYNLNGVQVAAGNLTPGIYVRVAGGKATKVVVK